VTSQAERTNQRPAHIATQDPRTTTEAYIPSSFNFPYQFACPIRRIETQDISRASQPRGLSRSVPDGLILAYIMLQRV
jgi:hypothetical protein